LTQPTCAVTTGTIVVTAPTGAGLEYSIDGTTYQATTIFNTVAAGTYNVTVRMPVVAYLQQHKLSLLQRQHLLLQQLL
jgi:hypothetical protein